MTMLEVHTAALADINEAYHEFLLRYDASKKSIYGFVEGKEDPSYYRSLVERFIPDDWSIEFLNAGNRNKVLETEAAFDWSRFSRQQIAFFVDRDLVHFLNPHVQYTENVYVTDGYSIENSIVTRDVFARLLEEVHNISDWTPFERDQILIYFDQQLHIFQEMLVPVMAQITIWRRDNVRANLSNFDLSSVIRIVDGNLEPAVGRETSDLRVARLCLCVGANASTIEQRNEMENQFRASNGPSTLTRGKYLVWFLSTIANDCHRRINVFVQAYQNPPRSKINLGVNNVLVVAAPRARSPNSLRAFIEQTFSTYISAKT